MKLRVPTVNLEPTSRLPRVEIRYNSATGLSASEATRLGDAIRHLDTVLALARAYVESTPGSPEMRRAYAIVDRLTSPKPRPRPRALVRP